MKRALQLLAIASVAGLTIITGAMSAKPQQQEKAIGGIEIIISAADRPIANIYCDRSLSSDSVRPSTTIQVARKAQDPAGSDAGFLRLKITPSIEGTSVRIDFAELGEQVDSEPGDATEVKENLRVIGSYLIPIGESLSIDEVTTYLGTPFQVKVLSVAKDSQPTEGKRIP